VAAVSFTIFGRARTVQATGAKFADRRVDMVRPLDVMAAQISLDCTLCIRTAILGSQPAASKNTRQEFAQGVGRDSNGFGAAM
jgi:hypothetical protein